MNYIYEKSTILGLEHFLAIPSEYMYQSPFEPELGSNWNHIKISMYLSYTNSAVDSNASFNAGSAEYSIYAGLSNFSFIGLGIYDPAPRIPFAGDNKGFAGINFDMLSRIDSDNGTTSNFIARQRANDVNRPDDSRVWLYTSVSNQILSSYSSFQKPTLPFPNIQNTSNFSGYLGFTFKILNRGEENQSISIAVNKLNPNGTRYDWNYNTTSDPSFSAFKIDLNNDSNLGLAFGPVEAVLPWHVDGVPLTIPNAFIFYNSFQQVRPRIHAWGIRKYA